MNTKDCDTGRFRGSMTALVTPFANGKVDWDCLARLVDRQIKAGTDWLVACGTTGESPTLTFGEHEAVIQAVIARAADRCPVMAGTGTNSTAESIRRTREAADAGADAALVVAPYYNKPTQEGLFRHFSAIAEAVDLPIVLYNVPTRTGVHIDNDTVVRLREVSSNIVAIKHATGNVEGVSDLLVRSDVAVLSGDDSITWPMMQLGAVGVISVIANLAPRLMKNLVDAALKDDRAVADAMHREVCDLADGLGEWGPNPLPIKTAMAAMGLLELDFRLPMCSPDDEAIQGIERVLQQCKVVDSLGV